jgi:hypothetical protein
MHPTLQWIELAMAAEGVGAAEANFRMRHFARQLASPFLLQHSWQVCLCEVLPATGPASGGRAAR